MLWSKDSWGCNKCMKRSSFKCPVSEILASVCEPETRTQNSKFVPQREVPAGNYRESEASEGETRFCGVWLWVHFLFFVASLPHMIPWSGRRLRMWGAFLFSVSTAQLSVVCVYTDIIYPAESDEEADLSSEDEGDIQVILCLTVNHWIISANLESASETINAGGKPWIPCPSRCTATSLKDNNFSDVMVNRWKCHVIWTGHSGK